MAGLFWPVRLGSDIRARSFAFQTSEPFRLDLRHPSRFVNVSDIRAASFGSQTSESVWSISKLPRTIEISYWASCFCFVYLLFLSFSFCFCLFLLLFLFFIFLFFCAKTFKHGPGQQETETESRPCCGPGRFGPQRCELVRLHPKHFFFFAG